MSVVQFNSIAAALMPSGPLHLAIGMFDGVHLGHRAVIDPAVRAARAEGGVSAVLTFWPHPSALFRPESATQLIQRPEIKAMVMARAGVEVVITQPFTPELAAISADAFVPWLRRQLPSLTAIYVGENFRYGHKRAGDATALADQGAALGIVVRSTPRVVANHETVSSTRIRSHLLAGEIEAANALLGYSYFSVGEIRTGKRLGRTLGFPTLNQDWSPELKPRYGVYAVTVRSAKDAAGSPVLNGVANYGVRPTVENTREPRLEVHVLGNCPFDAGDTLTVEWLQFLRPELKFSGIDQLRAQVATDRDRAAAYFATR